MQFIYVFLDIAKLADFLSKNADVSRTERVRHVSHIIFEFSTGKV